LVALALEQLIEHEGSTPIADRAVVLAAYLRLQRHQALRRQDGRRRQGSADPVSADPVSQQPQP